MPYLPNRLTRPRGRLHLPAACLADMLTEGWRTFPNETGGILLGTSHGDEVAVTTVIGPGPDATHARYTFTPDSDWQASQVAAAWHLNPDTEYLGDWHTHPGGTTHFSRLDTATAQSIADAPNARQPTPVMVVFALGVNASSRAAAARLRRGRLVPLALHVTPR
jgi:integrative and conjugative element protein (TIGR02256 family)